MITIGIRASPSAVTFAVYDSRIREIINVEDIYIPPAFSIPDALKYVRCNILDVLREFRIEQAGIRITESAADANPRRTEIEGVIQEAFASSSLQKYYIGQISSISARVGIARTAFKPLVNNKQSDGPVDNWATQSVAGREAILCAIGAVHA